MSKVRIGHYNRSLELKDFFSNSMLLGIVSNSPIYSICSLIEKHLAVKWMLSESIPFNEKKRQKVSSPNTLRVSFKTINSNHECINYYYQDSLNQITHHLYSNVSHQFYFINKYKQYHYFWLIKFDREKEIDVLWVENIIMTLQKEQAITHVQIINKEEYSFFANLVP